jgi:hypothetical protein
MLSKNNGYAMVRIYAFPSFFNLYLAGVPSCLELQYTNLYVYKKQRIFDFSKENGAGYCPKTIKIEGGDSFKEHFFEKVYKNLIDRTICFYVVYWND